MKNNKIIAINNTGIFPALVYDKIEEDKSLDLSDFRLYNRELLLISDIPSPTTEEIRKLREEAYEAKIDQITVHIQRLRDSPIPDEKRISELISERNKKVEEIKVRYPYPKN